MIFHNSVNSQLAEMERKFSITKRWLPCDVEYVQMKGSILTERRNQLHTLLRACVVKRSYLLKMKAKYYAGII